MGSIAKPHNGQSNLVLMQIRSKSHETLGRIQGCCSIDPHARSLSSMTILIIYVQTIPN